MPAERLHSLGFTHDATLEHMCVMLLLLLRLLLMLLPSLTMTFSTCKHFQIEGVIPNLAIGAVTMCRELLRVKRAKKAGLVFITGYPAMRPNFTAGNWKAAFGKHWSKILTDALEADFDAAPLLKAGFTVAEFVAAGFDVAPLLKAGVSGAELLAKGFKAVDVFREATKSKVDVKVLLLQQLLLMLLSKPQPPTLMIKTKPQTKSQPPNSNQTP